MSSSRKKDHSFCSQDKCSGSGNDGFCDLFISFAGDV